MTDHDLLWIVWALVLMLALTSLWLWLPIRETSKWGKLVKALAPAFIAASFYGCLSIQALHTRPDRDLFYTVAISDVVAVLVVWLPYYLSRRKKAGSAN